MIPCTCWADCSSSGPCGSNFTTSSPAVKIFMIEGMTLSITSDLILAADDIDVVWIGTQPYLHRPYAVAALEAGKHVFCQARMALDYADARLMHDAWARTDRTAMLCPPPHYMRGDRAMRRLLKIGRAHV